jgi:hypothetical protein
MQTTAKTVTSETPSPTARPTAVTNEEVWDFVTNPNSRGNHECDEDCTERITEQQGLEVTHECAPWELPGEVLAWFMPKYSVGPQDHQVRFFDGLYLIDEGELHSPLTVTHRLQNDKELVDFLFKAYEFSQDRLKTVLWCLNRIPPEVQKEYGAELRSKD